MMFVYVRPLRSPFHPVSAGVWLHVLMCMCSLFRCLEEEADSERQDDEDHAEVAPDHLHQEQRKHHHLPHQVRVKSYTGTRSLSHLVEIWSVIIIHLLT